MRELRKRMRAVANKRMDVFLSVFLSLLSLSFSVSATLKKSVVLLRAWRSGQDKTGHEDVRGGSSGAGLSFVQFDFWDPRPLPPIGGTMRWDGGWENRGAWGMEG